MIPGDGGTYHYALSIKYCLHNYKGKLLNRRLRKLLR